LPVTVKPVTVTVFFGKADLPGRPGAACRNDSDLNHLFMVGEGKSTPEEYLRPRHADALAAMCEFLFEVNYHTFCCISNTTP